MALAACSATRALGSRASARRVCLWSWGARFAKAGQAATRTLADACDAYGITRRASSLVPVSAGPTMATAGRESRNVAQGGLRSTPNRRR